MAPEPHDIPSEDIEDKKVTFNIKNLVIICITIVIWTFSLGGVYFTMKAKQDDAEAKIIILNQALF